MTIDPARRALAAFLRRTAGTHSWQRSDRALVLHLLQGAAPSFFRAQALAPELRSSLAALAEVPSQLGSDLEPAEAMARVDAVWLRHLHGLEHAAIESGGLSQCVLALARYYHPIWAWLLQELARDAGFPEVVQLPGRVEICGGDRDVELYFRTHEILLATRFFARPLPATGFHETLEALRSGAPWVVEHEHVDLAAEIALCLELHSESQARLQELLARFVHEDGAIFGACLGAEPRDRPRIEAHSTGAALVAIARAQSTL